MERLKARQRVERRRRAVRTCIMVLFGLLCRLVVAIGVGVLFWWWLEGFNKEVLPGMLEQVKGITGGISENLKLALMVSGGTFVALYVLKLIGHFVKGIVLIQIISFFAGGLSSAVLIISGHWGVGGLIALIVLAAIGAKTEHKVHESWWRWILMGIGLFVSGGFGLHGNWIISSVIAVFSFGLILTNED